jgi:penicillin-binding protein 1A
MRWARPVKDDKAPIGARGEPTAPSRVFKKGDVILVKLAEPSKPAKDIPIVELEQEPQVQGALVSIETQTGNVLALEGGYSFESSEFNRATQAQRQPGSAFKPIIYAAGLEKGFTPASIIVDSPIVYEDGDSGKWKPSNFEEKFYGDTTFRQALIHSRNVPTIKLAQALSVSTVLDYTKRLGVEGKFPSDLSISLGSASVSLLEMTKLYALFPRLGRKINPIFISKVMDRDGKVLDEQKPQVVPEMPTPSPSPSLSPQYPLAGDPDQVLDPRVAYVMTHIMNEVVKYGTGHEAKALNRATAGKTGTTSEYIDAWFMGFTPQVVTGVWVGFDSQKPIGPLETGAKAALPVWLSYMQDAVKYYPDVEFTVPSGVVFASIDSQTGKLTSPNSSRAIKEAFIEGTQPMEASSTPAASPEGQSEFFKEDTE